MKDSTQTALEALDKMVQKQVFTPEEVTRLWQWQFGPWSSPFDPNPDLPPQMHPFTCGKRENHPELAGDKGVLIPTVRGWICPFCDYTQDWAHDFMKTKPDV